MEKILIVYLKTLKRSYTNEEFNVGEVKLEKDGQKVQNSSFKIHKS